jgi:hypothetical protein
MRKLKRFTLGTSQILSNDEMSKLDGGFQLETCDAAHLGAHCLYTNGSFMATGICTYVNKQESNGSSTTTFSGYVCVMD